MGDKIGVYPIQYFYAKRSNKDGSTDDVVTQKLLEYFAKIGLSIGGIMGETEIPGVRLDFNNGLRLQIPAGRFHVRISDYDSGMVFFDEDVQEKILISAEKFYIHWQIDIWLDEQQVFSHIFDPTGQQVFFVFMSQALGDNLAFWPYIQAYQETFHGIVTCYVSDYLRPLLQQIYPQMEFREKLAEDTYATYYFTSGVGNALNLPLDGRAVPLSHIGRWTLGLHASTDCRGMIPVRSKRKIQERYVCIGVQASSTRKGWLNPEGWEQVIDWLRVHGYRVLCIDRERKVTSQSYTNEIPSGAEDFTGEYTLLERAEQLAHAEFFIGLGSGLSWLAHAVGCPTVMIGGFSAYWYEFPEAVRVFNPLVCNGCFNDRHAEFLKSTCPFYGGTDCEMECQKKISARQVIQAVSRLKKDFGQMKSNVNKS